MFSSAAVQSLFSSFFITFVPRREVIYMNVEIIVTEDGTNSLYVPALNETYHSTHGSLQEAEHIFLKAGLLEKVKEKKDINILEIGFGTGLNCLLTCCYADLNELNIDYVGVEAFPITRKVWTQLNYCDHLTHDKSRFFFNEMHRNKIGEKFQVHDSFSLTKIQQDIKCLNDLCVDYKEFFDVVYFDAFGPDVQPDLWTEDVFANCFSLMRDQGILMTYSVKGDIRRALKAVGFNVKKIPGPKGKREITRAIK